MQHHRHRRARTKRRRVGHEVHMAHEHQIERRKRQRLAGEGQPVTRFSADAVASLRHVGRQGRQRIDDRARIDHQLGVGPRLREGSHQVLQIPGDPAATAEAVRYHEQHAHAVTVVQRGEVRQTRTPC
jgi:hypothetical protein